MRAARRIRDALRSPIAIALLISSLVVLGIIALRTGGALESLELTAYDWYLRAQPATSMDRRIVLVTITEEDIQRLGHWPLTDATVADALTRLLAYRPRAIGLDLYRDLPVPPGRSDLDAVLKADRRVVVVTKIGEGTSDGIPPPSALANSDQVGFSDVVVDRGGIVRRGLLFLDRRDTIAYSFALRLALLYLQAENIGPQSDSRNPEHLRLGRTTIRPLEAHEGPYARADTGGYQFLLDFHGLPRGFPSFSFRHLLEDRIEPAALRDAIVILGVAAEGSKDFFYTPYSRGRDADQQISGIALHGHIASQLLRMALEGASPLRAVEAGHAALWIALWSLLGGVAGLASRSAWRFALIAGGGLLALGGLVYVGFRLGWWVPLIPPALGWFGAATLVTAYTSYWEKAQRAQLMGLFSRHLSPEIADAVWRQRHEFLDGGRPRPQRLTATVLFTDLVGYTSLSEDRSPQSLVEWLNVYMEAMAQPVIENDGLINQYIGDSIMALFGAPFPRATAAEVSRDAVNAVECALGMERNLQALNRRWQSEGLPTAAMRIGIFTGPVVGGSVGSAQRLAYTVIGDTVNTASRLESYAKDLFFDDPLGHPCRILIGATTASHLGERFELEAVGEVELKGKQRKVAIYRVVGHRRIQE